MNRRGFLKRLGMAAAGATLAVHMELGNIIPIPKVELFLNPVADYQAFAFPLIRRIFPALIAKELVSVQPMNGPTPTVYYLAHEAFKPRNRFSVLMAKLADALPIKGRHRAPKGELGNS